MLYEVITRVINRNNRLKRLLELGAPDVIVRAVRNAVRCPVMVKFRSGWENSPVLAVDLARRFEDAGADLLTSYNFV